MFEDATFDSRTLVPERAPRWMLFAFTVNCTVAAAMVMLPLLYPETMPGVMLRQVLYVPPAEPVSTMPQEPNHQATSRATSLALPLNLTRPTLLRPMANGPDEGKPSTDAIDLSGDDGVAGSGAGPQSSVFHRTTPTVVHENAPAVMKVSQGVSEGLLLSQVSPVYPRWAQTLHVSGTVELAAVISKEGRIEQLQVVSGHPALREAALDAVKQWRYRPYLLNGEPIAVETTIRINFKLAQ